MPECREDLPREIGHRSFAAGAGDRHRRLRLLQAVEAGRHQGQHTTRLFGAQYRNVADTGDLGVLPGQDGGRTLGNRIGNEACAVGLGAGDRREDETGQHVAAVGRDAGDLHISRSRRSGGVDPDERGEEHVSPSVLIAKFVATCRRCRTNFAI